MSYMSSQVEFSTALGVLLGASRRVLGGKFGLRLDWGFRDPETNARVGGHKKSLHMDRMAQDVTVYEYAGNDWTVADAETTAEVLSILHDIWDDMGGAERIPKDMGHFSWPWHGMR